VNRAELESFILGHICNKLDSQSAHIEQIRNRAAISAAVTGLVGTFFGALMAPNLPLLSGEAIFGLSVWAALGFSLFGLSIAFAVLVVVQVYDFTFSFQTEKMLLALRTSQSPSRFIARYVEDGEWFFVDNEQLIAKARANLWCSMVAGFAQIVPWMMVMIGVLKNGE
jgi:hypothetical protein